MYVRELVSPAKDPKTFWIVALDGTSVTTRSGKIGKAGRSSTKKCKDEGRALELFYKTSNKKLAEGYVCRHATPSPANGYIRLLIKGRSGQSRFVDIHPHTNHVAIGNADTIAIVDLDGVVQQTIPNTDEVRSLRFSPAGRYLVWQTIGEGPLCRVYDFTTKKVKAIGKSSSGISEGISFDASGARVAVTSGKATAIYETKTWKLVRQLPHTSTAVNPTTASAISPDGKRVAMVGADEAAIAIYNLATGTATSIPLGKGRGAEALAFSPDGKYLVAASVYQNDHTTRIFELATGKRHLPRLFSDTDGTNHFGVDISRDGTWLAAGGYFSRVDVWSFAKGKSILKSWDHYRRVYDVRFSGDGRYLLSSDYNAGFVVVHALTDELLKSGFEGPHF